MREKYLQCHYHKGNFNFICCSSNLD